MKPFHSPPLNNFQAVTDFKISPGPIRVVKETNEELTDVIRLTILFLYYILYLSKIN